MRYAVCHVINGEEVIECAFDTVSEADRERHRLSIMDEEPYYVREAE